MRAESTAAPLVCSVDGCDRPPNRRGGLCHGHYYRLRTHGDVRAELPLQKQWRRAGICEVDGCARAVNGRGLCKGHYARYRRHGDPLAHIPFRSPAAPPGAGTLVDGYRRVKRNGKSMAEHRRVMAEILGRPLYADETVHHRNGVRDDNRPDNLALRVGAHPKGLSIDEALAWAHEILRRYG